MKKLVSLIILNYNNNDYTINCLESLTNQSYKTFEVILVDNGSKIVKFNDLKGSINQLSEVLNIRLIRIKKNIYFTGGCNLGIKKAKGDYICLLNNDTIVEPDFIEKMVEFFEENPEAGIITPKIKFYKNKDLIWNAGSFLNFKYTDSIVTHRGFREKDINRFEEIKEIDFAPGTAMFIRKEVIEKVGFIDEIFFMYHEDPDLNLRAKKEGYKIYYVPTTTIYHNVPLDEKEKGSFLRFHLFRRNCQILFWKHRALIQIFRFYIAFIFWNLIEILLLIKKKKKIYILILINSLIQGFRIGLRRKTNRPCGKYMVNDYWYSKRVEKIKKDYNIKGIFGI